MDVDREGALRHPFLGERPVPGLSLADRLHVARLLDAPVEREEARFVALEDLAGGREDRSQDLAHVGLEIFEISLVAREELSLDGDQVGKTAVEEPASRVPVGP